MMEFDVAPNDRRTLLATAREAIASRLERRQPRWPDHGPALDLKRGAFVTLHERGMLRGCIGRMIGDEPLIDIIRDMALSSAFGDPRFPPLEPDELPLVDIEISVLSPMERCRVEDIKAGVHGAYLIFGGRAGVFLPQVATEQGWDSATFLEELCVKAGVPRGSHLDPRAELFRFTAVVFGEREEA